MKAKKIDSKILNEMKALWEEVESYFPGGYTLEEFHKCQRWQRWANRNPEVIKHMRNKS